MEDINPEITHQTKLNPEDDFGNIEYKYKLTNLDVQTLNHRQTQMQFRICEGNGEAFYHIGIMDDGTPVGLSESEYVESVQNLNLIADRLGCQIIQISSETNNGLSTGHFLVKTDNNEYIDLKIGVAGNVDAGKSTTIGTLTKGVLDDGRGKARLHVFNFKHEILTGRTSSIGHQIMGFDSQGQILNSKFDRQLSWTEIVAQSSKIVTFFETLYASSRLKLPLKGILIIGY
jgi:GTPase